MEIVVENVGQANFLHFFHELLRKSLESYKWWKKLSKPTFSTISASKTAVLEAEIVEKVGFDNFFHHFYDSKDFLNNSWKKWKKLAWPTFSTIQAVLEAEIVEKVGQANFLRVLPILSMLEEEPPNLR